MKLISLKRVREQENDFLIIQLYNLVSFTALLYCQHLPGGTFLTVLTIILFFFCDYIRRQCIKQQAEIIIHNESLRKYCVKIGEPIEEEGYGVGE